MHYGNMAETCLLATRMAISVSKKKSRLSKRKEANEISFFYSFLSKVFLRFPAAIFLLILVLLYASSTIIISGNIVHVCVSSRKLNNLYCMSAGSQPSFEVPITRVNDSSTSSTNGENKVNVKEVVGVVLEKSIAAVNNSVAKPHHEGLVNGHKDVEVPTLLADDKSSSANGNQNDDPVQMVNSSIEKPKNEALEDAYKDVEVPVPLVHDNSTSVNGDGKHNLKENVDVDFESPTQTANSIIEKPKDEELANAYKEVEEQLRVHRSWASDHSHPSCDGRGIYVYELPSKFNKELADHCGDMIPWVSLCKYFSNEALGEPMQKLGKGWYQTHQYLLEPVFHSRVLKHPCRVYNENEAMLFYVPYYGGLDILRWHFKNVSNDVKDSLAFELIRWLETQEPWFRNAGKDHVFVLGKISWDFRRNSMSSWGTRLLELAEMQNPIKLLIERQPWEVNDIGIPHPTSFHPHTDDDIVSWQLKIIKSNRRSLVGFAGGARPDDPHNFRSILIKQCTSIGNGECKFLNCSSGGCDQQESIIELFMESEFCLQPPGDSPTRKSVFDSLVSGCIPVLFDPFTAYYQYPWYLPKDHDKYSVFIDKDEVKNKEVNAIERLMKIPVKERENMRRYIVYELLPGLVYADSSAQLEKFQDAFTIAMDNLLQRVNKLDEL